MWPFLTALLSVLGAIFQWWIARGQKRDEAKGAARDLQKQEADRALEILTGDTESLSRADYVRNLALYWALRDRRGVHQENSEPSA